VKLPKQARPRDVYLRAAQLTCSPARAGWLRSLVLLLLGVGGLRWGEVISLRVYDVSTRTRTALWWLSGHDRVSRGRHRQMSRPPAVDRTARRLPPFTRVRSRTAAYSGLAGHLRGREPPRWCSGCSGMPARP